jgi:hypothetical protein
MATAPSSIHYLVREYGPTYGRKVAFIAIAWIAIYFISQPFRQPLSAMMLFAPMIGSIAGLVAGWYMAENSVEDSSLSGLPLFVLLVVGAVLPMWGMEGILHMIFGKALNFGGFMLLTAASLLALAASVWHASSQE